MAGIGFELKKLYSKDDKTYEKLRNNFYSSFTIAGTTLVTFITLKVIDYLQKYYAPLEQTVHFSAGIAYSFIFSQIIASPWLYFLNRYIADCIYEEKEYKIKGSLVGALRITIVTSYILGLIYTSNSILPTLYNYLFVLLFVILSCLWIVSIYISVLKKYQYIVKTYLQGGMITCILSFLFFKFPVIDYFIFFPPTKVLFAYTIGMAFILAKLVNYVLVNLHGDIKHEYDFIKYIFKYKELFYAGIFVVLGTWGHVLLHWLLGDSYLVGGIFRITGNYFTMVGYSVFSIIPLLVYFNNIMETEFYVLFQDYYNGINSNFSLEKVNNLKKRMINSIKNSFKYAYSLQLMLTTICLFQLKPILNFIGVPLSQEPEARLIFLGVFSSIFFTLFTVLLLYFDQRAVVVKNTRRYVVLTTLLEIIAIKIGYSGGGFFIGSFISLIYSDYSFTKVIENINYESFYNRNFYYRTPKILAQIEKILYKRVDLILVLIAQLIFHKR